MFARFLIIFFLATGNASGQYYNTDSLLKLVENSTGKNRVDQLNAMAKAFTYYVIHSDSALEYANRAYREAVAIHYKKGEVTALFAIADVNGKLLGHPKIMERYSRDALKVLKTVHEPGLVSDCYYRLALSLAQQGLYDSAHSAAANAKKKAYEARDKRSLAWAKEAAGFIYAKSGAYWEAFGNLNEAQKTGAELKDSLLTAVSLAFIARSFNRAGDPRKALYYYHQCLQWSIPFLLLWPHLEDMAYAHLQLKQYDSAAYYQQKHRYNIESLTKDQVVQKRFSASLWGFSVSLQLEQKQYDTILIQLLPMLEGLRQSGDVLPFMQSLLVLGKVYEAKKMFTKSLQLARELLHTAEQSHNKQFSKDAHYLMATLFEKLKRVDSAYAYFRRYTALNDSMETVQFAQRTSLYLAASEAASKIELLNKDKAISEQQLVLNAKELQKQSQLKNLLLVCIVVLILFSILVMRNIILKRKNEKLRYEQNQLTLKRRALELEMQALRAQMNPHFIFNCLSAIDNLMQTRQPDKATAYLARFAKLIRSILDSSKNNIVPFQKDFEALRLYLEMEQFRCNNKFSYQLDADPELLEGDYKVPPLIIQPFVENAIHHGLLNKQDKNRQLSVYARLEKEHIIYSVTDNGIGRKKAAIVKEMNKPGQQSHGINITRERIHLHNRNHMGNDVQIRDLELEGCPVGTTAIVKINSGAY